MSYNMFYDSVDTHNKDNSHIYMSNHSNKDNDNNIGYMCMGCMISTNMECLRVQTNTNCHNNHSNMLECMNQRNAESNNSRQNKNHHNNYL